MQSQSIYFYPQYLLDLFLMKFISSMSIIILSFFKTFVQMNKKLKLTSLSENIAKYSQFPKSSIMIQKLKEKKGFSNFAKSGFFQDKSSVMSRSFKNSQISESDININSLSGRDYIERLFLDVKSVQQEKNNLSQQIQFYLLNFQYILELFSENMTKFMAEKLIQINDEKNQKITSLQKENKMLKEKIDDYEKKEGETIKLKELVCGLQEDLLYSRMRNHELKEKLQEKENCASARVKNFSDGRTEIFVQEQDSRMNRNFSGKLFNSSRFKTQIPLMEKSYYHTERAMNCTRRNSGQIDGIQIEKLKDKISKLKTQLLEEE